MAKENERRFLLWENGIDYTTPEFYNFYSSVSDLKRDVLKKGVPIIQGYLPIEKGIELLASLNMTLEFNPIEARLRDRNGEFLFNMKSDGKDSRDELPDIALPSKVFLEYWPLTAGRRVAKKRLKLPFSGYDYQIDVHLDRYQIRAEVETETLEELRRVIPIGLEVTENSAYNARNLAK